MYEPAFAKFEVTANDLAALLNIEIQHPVNAMTAIMKHLGLPKKISLDAISTFAAQNGEDPASAHDVYCAINEVTFLMKSNGYDQVKIVKAEEIIARCLKFKNWKEYDFATSVSW